MKSPGQIAYEAFRESTSGYMLEWDRSRNKQAWEDAAKAVTRSKSWRDEWRQAAEMAKERLMIIRQNNVMPSARDANQADIKFVLELIDRLVSSVLQS